MPHFEQDFHQGFVNMGDAFDRFMGAINDPIQQQPEADERQQRNERVRANI